jgi:hypothetical protein
MLGSLQKLLEGLVFIMAGVSSVTVMASPPASIHDVNLKNFSYPFLENESVPDAVRWMPVAGTPVIDVKDGRHSFLSQDCGSPDNCPLLTLDKIQYADLAGIAGSVALVVTTYHSGGTATWQYIYVVAFRSGRPQVVAWLETGSRAYQGLRRLSVERGDLVLSVNDPAKREGDCCSSGTITTRYRRQNGSFAQIGQAVTEDVPK